MTIEPKSVRRLTGEEWHYKRMLMDLADRRAGEAGEGYTREIENISAYLRHGEKIPQDAADRFLHAQKEYGEAQTAFREALEWDGFQENDKVGEVGA